MFAEHRAPLLHFRRPLCRLSQISLAGLTLLLSFQVLAQAETAFERVQLSNQFYSEGGTHGDYDGDGHGDVCVGPWIYYGPDFTEKSRFYEGDAFPPEKYSENFLMYTNDVNANGRHDILVLGFPGKESWWYENPGPNARKQLWKQHVILDSVDNESPLIADIDGDGSADLICSSKGHYGYATHAGQDPTKMWRFVQISPNNGYQRFTHGVGIGDVNNDGHQDLLEKDGWWQNPGKGARQSTDQQTAADKSTDGFWVFHPFAFSETGGAQMFAVDLDGDGRNEVLTGLVAHGYGLAYYKALNAEATQFEKIEIMTDDPATSPVGLAVSQLHAMDLGDINRDGLPDIVTGKRWWAHANKDPGNSQPATLLWLELQRSGQRVKFTPHVIDNSSGVGTQITVGDVNGDGLLDIVSGNKRGAYLFLQRPSAKPHQVMIAKQAGLDAFDQQPALEVIQLAGSPDFVPALAGNPLNFSFEDESLRDWEVRGPMADNVRSKFAEDSGSSGQFVVDTGSSKPALIGELISRPFKLASHSQLRFLLGGKSDPEARVELVDEANGIVLEAVRPTAEKMQPVQFNIMEHAGKLVRIRIIDHSAEAYLQVDDFRLIK